MLRIGIPRALYFYSYLPFWHAFWTKLGHKVIVSPLTNKGILDHGVKEASTDLCVPVKVLHGHIAYLAAKDKVDAIFLPRMVNVGTKATFCPKFLGLPEMVSSAFCQLPPLIVPRVDLGNPWHLFNLCHKLQRQWAPEGSVWLAYRAALSAQNRFQREIEQGRLLMDCLHNYTGDVPNQGRRPNSPSDGALRVAVLGYPYAVYDSFLNGNSLKKLQEMGVRVYTADMVPLGEQKRYRRHKDLFWHYSNVVLQAGQVLLDSTLKIDGVINISNFACGPDAMVGKLLEFECKKRAKPMITLTLDEQTGEGGINTRIEAFVDMLARRKDGAHNLSLHGQFSTGFQTVVCRTRPRGDCPTASQQAHS